MLRYDLMRIGLLGWVILLMVGCRQNLLPSTPEIVQVEETRVPPLVSEDGDATPMTQPLPTPSDLALQGLIQKTKEDLAQRLSISTAQISLVEATEVEWSDSSLGCPQPDMAYLEVITPGYRILLQANTMLYEYHSNRDAYFVYCENQVPPFIPKP